MFNVLLTKNFEKTRDGLLLMIFLSLALRSLPWPSCWEGREAVLCYLSVSDTINIITFTDVWHDWRGRGGAGDVEGLLGRIGIGGGDGWFSSMLTIGLHVRDTNIYMKCLGISHNAAILEKVREITNLFSRPASNHYFPYTWVSLSIAILVFRYDFALNFPLSYEPEFHVS